MPVTRGRDATGPFYRYGKDVHPGQPASGKKYYYVASNASSRAAARALAARQGRAIEAAKALRRRA